MALGRRAATLWLLCISPVAAAAPLSVSDLLQLRVFLGSESAAAALTADGQWATYTLGASPAGASLTGGGMYGETGAPADGYARSDLWVINTRTGSPQCVTRGEGKSLQPSWSPDGEQLAFYSDRDGMLRLWIWSRRTGALRRVSEAITRPSGFAGAQLKWTPDGRYLIALVLPEGMSVEQANARARSEATSDTDDPTITPGATAAVWRSPMASHDSASAESIRVWAVLEADWALVNASTGAIRRLGRSKATFWYAPSPDGKWLAFSHQVSGALGSTETYYDLEIAPLAAGETKRIAGATLADYGLFQWSPDGTKLAYIAADESRRGDIHIVDRASGIDRVVSIGSHENFGAPYGGSGNFVLWTHDARTLLFAARERLWRVATAGGPALPVTPQGWSDRVRKLVSTADGTLGWHDRDSVFVLTQNPRSHDYGFHRVALATGKAVLLFEEPKQYSGAILSPTGGSILWAAEDARHPPDMWITRLDRAVPRRLTQVNPQYTNVQLGAMRIIDYPSPLGGDRQAVLLLPVGYAQQRVPLIVWAYPGEWNPADHANSFGFGEGVLANMQMLAARGYAVLHPQVPQRLGTPLQDAVAGINAVVDRAIDLGIADSERLGIGGISYGGYSTLALITHTPRFRAAVAVAGPANLISAYGAFRASGRDGSYWAETGQGLLGGHPWQYRERYIENSPLFFLDRVSTPLLLIHGEKDSNVSVQQSDETFVGLRRLGKVVEYRRYAGEGHALSGRENVVDYWTAMIRWFDRYVKGEG